MKKSICQNNNKHEVIYLAYGKMDFKYGIISKFCRLLPFLSKECYLGHLLHEGNSNCGGVLLMSRLQRTDACKAVCSACLHVCGKNSAGAILLFLKESKLKQNCKLGGVLECSKQQCLRNRFFLFQNKLSKCAAMLAVLIYCNLHKILMAEICSIRKLFLKAFITGLCIIPERNTSNNNSFLSLLLL